MKLPEICNPSISIHASKQSQALREGSKAASGISRHSMINVISHDSKAIKASSKRNASVINKSNEIKENVYQSESREIKAGSKHDMSPEHNKSKQSYNSAANIHSSNNKHETGKVTVHSIRSLASELLVQKPADRKVF